MHIPDRGQNKDNTCPEQCGQKIFYGIHAQEPNKAMKNFF
jgi:hypothetical protein